MCGSHRLKRDKNFPGKGHFFGDVVTFINRDRGSTVANKVQLAGTSRERRRGLLGRDDFAGLWIVPCEAIHTFGMRVEIDAVFLDRELRVRGLKRHLRPGRISFCLRAHSVLELPAGAISSSGTATGDRLEMQDAA